MRVRIISFSEKGSYLAKRIADKMDNCSRFAPKKYCIDDECEAVNTLSEWTRESFSSSDAIIFVGALGICVRAISPYVSDKRYDPAVVAIDELGTFSIPVLSGHIGGANELAIKISDIISAQPVITTATDINGVFAVDVFARKNDLYIDDITLVKAVSSALLRGEKIGFYCDVPVSGNVPEIFIKDAKLGISISENVDLSPFEETLHLIPKRITIGIGCKRGKSVDEIEKFVLDVLKENEVNIKQIKNVCSIDIKQDEKGILDFCKKHRLEFVTYTADELNSVLGEFSSSDFVKSRTGVDCVCERAAVMGSNGELILKKQSGDGITVALARMIGGVYFE